MLAALLKNWRRSHAVRLPKLACRGKRAWWLAGALACAAGAGHAGEVRSIAVSREGQVYTVGMTAHIEAPADAVYALFTDYAHLDELSPALRETKLQARIDKTHARVYSLTHFCIWIFCTDIHQVQIMEKLPANGLRATTVPGGSDFSAGWIQWRFAAAQDDTTRVSFTSQFVPDFWVPPLIGPALIRHALRGQARLTLRGIERAYRRRAGRLSGPGLEASLARLNTIGRQVQNADPLPSDPEVVEAP